MAELQNGTDFFVLDQLDPTFPLATGKKALAARTFRRVTTDPTLGIFELPSGEPACLDLSDLLSEQLDTSSLGDIENQIRRVCSFDPEIDSVAPTVSFLDAERRLKVRILITPADGSAPFALVLSVDAVTAQVLSDAELG